MMLQKKYEGAILLNRLDKETSGVMMFAKMKIFKKAIKDSKQIKFTKSMWLLLREKLLKK